MNDSMKTGRATMCTPPSCDNCGRKGPEIEEIWKQPAGRTDGMRGMGWRCNGGKSTCPECLAKEEEQ